ncbi:hypothetical protein K438DRAFT_1764279 [Mycena galopus ATCC 62051]|nr:hypothetical protein K438DRAFT_1764279 [Mycena galopus ATCC 62051]
MVELMEIKRTNIQSYRVLPNQHAESTATTKPPTRSTSTTGATRHYQANIALLPELPGFPDAYAVNIDANSAPQDVDDSSAQGLNDAGPDAAGQWTSFQTQEHDAATSSGPVPGGSGEQELDTYDKTCHRFAPAGGVWLLQLVTSASVRTAVEYRENYHTLLHLT